jgi:pyridoxine 5'-phosphate synthase PdxJ
MLSELFNIEYSYNNCLQGSRSSNRPTIRLSTLTLIPRDKAMTRSNLGLCVRQMRQSVLHVLAHLSVRAKTVSFFAFLDR